MSAPTGEQLLLVSMPFGALDRPSIALGLLQAHANGLGIPCDTRYLGFDFAALIGVGEYSWIADTVPYTAFLGDWLFAEALYGPNPPDDVRYLTQILRNTWSLGTGDISRALRARTLVEPFLDACMRSVPFADYSFVGFTSVFHQNIASLALAKRIKAAHPEITVAFGGANWEEEMGETLLTQFEFVDLAFSGEADQSFPAVLEARRRGDPVMGIPGVIVPGGGRHGLATTHDMDSVPVPDYEPFFSEREGRPALGGRHVTLIMETARGCWWGERSHCTFCGLNGSTMAFRSKSPERVLDEITFLRSQYDSRVFSIVDDILDMRYFRTVMPRLADANLDVEFFWEVKANLTHAQVRLLDAAGVKYIQPGIESLSDHVLDLMRKGVSTLRNVQLLKWCREFGVKPLWNLLYGFPGETAEDYESSADVIRAIWHLQPPTGYGPIRLDRFSPYHDDPASFGMISVRPLAPFAHLYPFDNDVVMRVAYYFDFDYADGRGDDDFAADVVELTKAWMADDAPGELWLRHYDEQTVVVVDSRRGCAEPQTAVLEGWKATVYLACDRAHSVEELSELDAVRSADVSATQLDEFLQRCAVHQLMITSGGQWLSVAVHHPARTADDHTAPSRRYLQLLPA